MPVNRENCERLGERWGFAVPDTAGLTAPEMVAAAARNELDVLVSMGGNFLEVLPDPHFVRDAISRIGLRVHYDIVLSSQMLVEPADTVLLLPATTRYEIPGGVTETSTERRVIFSPYIDGGPVAEARPEGDVMLALARRVRPDRSALLHFQDTGKIRAEIAEVIPMYDGIQRLHSTGDQFQYGGRILCRDGVFPTADGRARFTAVAPTAIDVPEGWFQVTTRRGKQFNSMVQEQRDSLTGARRDAVFMSSSDIEKLGLRDGEEIVLRNDVGSLHGRVFQAPVKQGSVQVHFPEGNALVDRSRHAPLSGIPDYNAVARVERPAPAPR